MSTFHTPVLDKHDNPSMNRPPPELPSAPTVESSHRKVRRANPRTMLADSIVLRTWSALRPTEENHMNTNPLDRIYFPLWLCYGLVPIIAGADKFLNLLTDWSRYLPEFVIKLIPVTPSTFMKGVGVIEIVAGLLVLTVLPRLGAYVVAAWLVLISLAAALAGYFDIAVRDLVMALGAYTLGSLAAARGLAIIPRRNSVATESAH